MSNPHLIQRLQTRIAAQKQDLQTLLLDNQTLAASHVALKQELDSSRSNIQILADMASKTRAERDAEIIVLIENLKKKNEDASKVESLKRDLERIRLEVGKLEKEKSEMEEKVGKLKEDTEKLKVESGKVEDVKREIEYMRREVDRGRAAIEYEKKVHADYVLHRQRMEENIFAMAREVEQLRCELADAVKRARAVAAVSTTSNPGCLVSPKHSIMKEHNYTHPKGSRYPDVYGNRDTSYGGSTYSSANELHQFLHMEAPVAGGNVHQFASTAVPAGPFSMQQTEAHR